MENKPFKVTVEHHGRTISLSNDNPDIHFDEFMEMVKTIAGHVYTQGLWDRYFNELTD